MDFLKRVENFKEDIIKSTQEIIQIKSVEEKPNVNMPFGEGPFKALEYALKLSDELGFKTKNLDNYVGYAEFGDGDETVGVLVHLDVVPEGDGWTYPPYGGEIHDNKIYGRGTIDDKGPTISIIYAMKALLDSNMDLKRKIRLIFGTNEETNWGCMDYYFKHEETPTMAFTPDSDFPVIYGEKGIISFDLVQEISSRNCCDMVVKSISGGNAANMVPDSCEAIIEVEDINILESALSNFRSVYNYPITIERLGNDAKIIATGISAHGSRPELGENAISYLMRFLGYVIGGNCDICSFINIYNERIAFKHNGEDIGCGFSDSISGKLTFNPGVIKLADNKIVLTINVRYPINSSGSEVYDGIRENLKFSNIKLIEGNTELKPLYVPKDNFLVKKLMDVYRKETGDMESEPITIGGGTYARAMDNAVAFGPAFPGQKDVAHQKDEFIDIDDLMKVTRIYALALYELAK